MCLQFLCKDLSFHVPNCFMCLCAHGYTLEEAQSGLIPQEPSTFFETGFLSKQARLTSRGILEIHIPPQCWEVSIGHHSWKSEAQSQIPTPASQISASPQPPSPSCFTHYNSCSRGSSLVWVSVLVSVFCKWWKFSRYFTWQTVFLGKHHQQIFAHQIRGPVAPKKV